MRTLTVQQPWAWAIVLDDVDRKDIENRTFRTAPGELLIHAGLRWSDRGAEHELLADLAERHGMRPATFAQGAIIGRVHVDEIHEATPGCCPEGWAEQSYLEHGGRLRTRLYHWRTTRLETFDPPKPARGRQGLWDYELEEGPMTTITDRTVTPRPGGSVAPTGTEDEGRCR